MFETNLQKIDISLAYKIIREKDSYTYDNSMVFEDFKDNVSVLYVYGIGGGECYEGIEGWLRLHQEHRLIFLEEDLSVLRHFMGTERGSRILNDAQVKIVYLSEHWRREISQLTMSMVLLDIHVDSKRKTERFEEIRAEIMKITSSQHYLASEFYNYGLRFYENFYANITNITRGSQGERLFRKFKNMPAIICGAGPSLNKQIPLIRHLDNNALVFAGGSALTALTDRGVMPHFGVAVDPLETENKCLSPSRTYETPFFCSYRLHSSIFDLLNGPSLYTYSDIWYPIVKWFDDRSGILKAEEELFIGRGCSVITTAIEIASALGCDPIILVGVDLGYTNNKKYAEGVFHNNTAGTEDLWQPSIQTKGVDGKELETRWEWLVEASWIGDFKTESKIINATEGGLGMEGVPTQRLSDIAKKYCLRNFDFNSLVAAEVQQAQIKAEGVDESLQEIKDSLARCHKHVLDVLKNNDKLAEHELHEELAYQYIFRPMMIMLKEVLEREALYACDNIESKEFKQMSIQENTYTFLRDAIEAHQEMVL
jgi:hypothetical protein